MKQGRELSGKTMNKLGLGNAHYFDNSTNPKFEEIKKLLDSNGMKEKFDGMKRLIALMSKGRDVSFMYPQVVKNCFIKNMQVKKLVYLYLVHYAELEPDPALLAINNFQRDMQSQNPLMRSLGIRCLSNIRLKVIVQVVAFSLKKACKDTSPYVRKATAHAIPKIYSLDTEQLPGLVEVLEALLEDRAPMVIGSAVRAFNEICPTRYDLLHQNFRNICNVIHEVDEWGQAMILTVLTRYGRHEFANPESEKERQERNDDKIFENSSEEDESEEDDYDDGFGEIDANEIEPDHRLLLQATEPLLRSCNASVVLAAATLFYYLAPTIEAQKVGKSLSRCLRQSSEVQYIVLSNIVSMARSRPEMFQPYLLDFFIHVGDSHFVRTKKLGILTRIANGGNINKILDELNSYVRREDDELVTASIQAIGRCASRLKDVSDSVLRTLMNLMSNSNQDVVAESIIVIKKLLQSGSKQKDFPVQSVVKHLAKILDEVTAPEARASIIWAIGEYVEHIQLRAPDILRKLAISFKSESSVVKLQAMNLGAKLILINPQQTKLITQYILDMARYDLDYDVRDRERIMRPLLIRRKNVPELGKRTKKLFISEKPMPTDTSDRMEKDTPTYMLGSLSHSVGHKSTGYVEIEDYQETSRGTDRTPKNVYSTPTPPIYDPNEESIGSPGESSYTDSYTDSYSGSESYSGSDSYSDDYTDSYSGSESFSGSESEYTDEEFDYGKPKNTPKPTQPSTPASPGNDLNLLNGFGSPSQSTQNGQRTGSNNNLMDLGLNFGKSPSSSPAPGNSGNLLVPLATSGNMVPTASPNETNAGFDVELLNHIKGGGIGIKYRFLRRSSMHGNNHNVIELQVKNHTSDVVIQGVRMEASSSKVKPFPLVSMITPGDQVVVSMSIAFESVTKAVPFTIMTSRGTYKVSIKPLAGELLRETAMNTTQFDNLLKNLGGMNEMASDITMDEVDENAVEKIVLTNCRASLVDKNDGVLRFAGVTVLGKDEQCLVSVYIKEDNVKVQVNCGISVFTSVLLKELKLALSKH